MRRIGILYHPTVPAAESLAGDLAHALVSAERQVWSRSAWDDSATGEIAGTDLLVCIGGDGTMLRGARLVVPHPIPVLGVNMGRLGFLSEVSPVEALARLRDVLGGDGRVERRMMLRAEVLKPGDGPVTDLPPQEVLNDVAVGRHGGRPVNVHVHIDGVRLESVRADGVVLSTATGSTGYNLSAGGPVLWPESDCMVLTPIAAHLSHVRPIVLPGDTRVELRIETDLRGIVSFDGQVDYLLAGGASVVVRRSEHIARFVRLGPPSDFYRNLTQLLGRTHGGDGRE